MPTKVFSMLLIGVIVLSFALLNNSSSEASNDEAKVLAALDTEYQRAVEINDAATMYRILADDFMLVLGDGRSFTKTDLIKSARDKYALYEIQADSKQTVRVWGNTAVITALLTSKGKYTETGKTFDYQLWFSDTYVRTGSGWKYVFGQASLPLPAKK